MADPLPDDVDMLMPETPAPHVPLSGPGGGYTSEPSPRSLPAPESSAFGRVLGAFHKGFNEPGPASGDFSPDTTDQLKQLTKFDTWPRAVQNIPLAVHEALTRPTVYDLSVAWHAMTGALSGGQAAVAQLGEEVGHPKLGRDIAAIPEAFPTFEFAWARRPAPSRRRNVPVSSASLRASQRDSQSQNRSQRCQR